MQKLQVFLHTTMNTRPIKCTCGFWKQKSQTFQQFNHVGKFTEWKYISRCQNTRFQNIFPGAWIESILNIPSHQHDISERKKYHCRMNIRNIGKDMFDVLVTLYQSENINQKTLMRNKLGATNDQEKYHSQLFDEDHWTPWSTWSSWRRGWG